MVATRGAGRPARAGWPLVTLAALSFIPLLGILFGGAAITWGLVSDRRRSKLAVGLGAAGTALNLAAALFLTWRLQNTEAGRAANADLTRRHLATLVWEIERYRQRRGQYPPSLVALAGSGLRLPPIDVYDKSAGAFSRRVYQYRLAPGGRAYDLFSVGPDGVAGTGDDLRPLLSDSLARTTGYRPRP